MHNEETAGRCESESHKLFSKTETGHVFHFEDVDVFGNECPKQ